MPVANKLAACGSWCAAPCTSVPVAGSPVSIPKDSFPSVMAAVRFVVLVSVRRTSTRADYVPLPPRGTGRYQLPARKIGTTTAARVAFVLHYSVAVGCWRWPRVSLV
uniref:Putative secreted protein n=1 Tax=Anopheles triannulatus TaxID=58253 RepID=A0A2M4B5U7_9DIPT